MSIDATNEGMTQLYLRTRLGAKPAGPDWARMVQASSRLARRTPVRSTTDIDGDIRAMTVVDTSAFYAIFDRMIPIMTGTPGLDASARRGGESADQQLCPGGNQHSQAKDIMM